MNKQGGPRIRIASRFWNHVQKTDSCWLWTGKKTEKGYGVLNRGGRDGVRVRAHRLSWEIHFGPVPKNLFVLHRCDNPSCVNPAHLWLGTIADNQADMVAKGRQGVYPRQKPGAQRGEKNNNARLTDDLVRQIRTAHAVEHLGCLALVRRFGFSHPTISRILAGKTWSHVV